MRNPHFYSFAFMVYLLLIGLALGAIIASAFSAPVIFRAASFVEGLEITLFQSSVLMTQIFIKLNILLNILAVFIIIYEVIIFKTTRQKIAPLLGFISVILILLFTLYYTPYILQAQQMGEESIQTLKFDAMHKQSVLVFKTLLITLFLLFCIRSYKLINNAYKGK